MPIKADWIDFKLPNVKSLSDESGVYEIGYASNGRVIYIGKSNVSIRARLLDHIEKHKFTNTTHFRFRKTNPNGAKSAEDKLLKEFCKRNNGKPPKHNTQKPSSKKQSLADWWLT